MKGKTDLVIGAYVINNDRILLVHHAKLDKWLPPGGHIEANETPDEAILREIKEETGIDAEFIQKEEIPKDKNDSIVIQLALPFYANVHNVGDHNHACLFYLCRAKNDKVTLSHESKGHRWVTLEELMNSHDIPSDVKKIGKLAMEKIKQN
ncbi:MAG: NUDIX hydrolase [Candidatus Aenigmatarchaeota archaeon]